MLETFLIGGRSSDATTEDSFSVNIENIDFGGRLRSAHNTERPDDSTAALTLPPHEFVTYFALINSVKTKLVLGHVINAHDQPEQVTSGQAAPRYEEAEQVSPREQVDRFAEREIDDNDDYGYNGEFDEI